MPPSKCALAVQHKSQIQNVAPVQQSLSQRAKRNPLGALKGKEHFLHSHSPNTPGGDSGRRQWGGSDQVCPQPAGASSPARGGTPGYAAGTGSAAARPPAARGAGAGAAPGALRQESARQPAGSRVVGSGGGSTGLSHPCSCRCCLVLGTSPAWGAGGACRWQHPRASPGSQNWAGGGLCRWGGCRDGPAWSRAAPGAGNGPCCQQPALGRVCSSPG